MIQGFWRNKSRPHADGIYREKKKSPRFLARGGFFSFHADKSPVRANPPFCRAGLSLPMWWVGGGHGDKTQDENMCFLPHFYDVGNKRGPGREAPPSPPVQKLQSLGQNTTREPEAHLTYPTHKKDGRVWLGFSVGGGRAAVTDGNWHHRVHCGGRKRKGSSA